MFDIMYFEIIFELWQSQSTELNIAFDLFVQLSVSSAFRKKIPACRSIGENLHV